MHRTLLVLLALLPEIRPNAGPATLAVAQSRRDYEKAALRKLKPGRANAFTFGRFQSPAAVKAAFNQARSPDNFKRHKAKDGREGRVCSTKLGGDWVLAESEQVAPSCSAEQVLKAYLDANLQKRWNADKVSDVKFTRKVDSGGKYYQQDIKLHSVRVIRSHTGPMSYSQRITVDKIGSGAYSAFVQLDPKLKSSARKPFESLGVHVALEQRGEDVHIYAAGVFEVNRRVVPNLLVFDASGIAGDMAGKGTLWLAGHFRERKATGAANQGAGVNAAAAATVEDCGAAVVVEPAPTGRVLYALWAFKRSIWIWGNVLGHSLKVARLRNSGLEGGELVEARRKQAAELRDTLIRLGPTFIKIGQLMSTRVDVFPPEVLSELSQLQNDVPSFPADRAMRIIRDELGQSVDELYAKFDPRPLAAASLAQVHRAVLRTGEEVVVKVQRENLLDLFKVDLWNIQLVARLADRLDPQTESASANWKAIADTSGGVLYREADFKIERRAAETFADNFKDLKNIKIPDTYPELSSSKVLTMEYVPGVKISDTAALEARGFDPVHLATELTNSYLEQVCRHGFFHCDPHPGNLAVDDGAPGGRLIYYDFGMMEVMEPEIKKGFVDLVFSIYENLPREACDAMEAMGVLRPGIDRFSIERIARDYLNLFDSTLASADNKWENQMSEEEKRASRRARRARIGQDLFATQADKPFLFPPKWTFVFRAFSTIDGIGKGLYPGGYDLSRISQPYLRELANLRDGSTTTTALREVGRRLGLRPVDIAEAVTQPRSVASLSRSMARIEQGDVKLRVRALDVERQLERVEEKQLMIGGGIGAGLLLDVCLRAGTSTLMRWPLALGAGKLAWEAWRASARLGKLEEQRLRFANEGLAKYDEADLTIGEEIPDDGCEMGSASD